MSMTEVPFDKELELDDWVKENLELFVPGSISIPGHQVSTTTGKRGVPDGFAFNLHDRQWFVIENDLLGHGVWTHIAEQIVRFVVAMQNPDTRRLIRDHLFEALIERDLVGEACETLGTSSERLLQLAASSGSPNQNTSRSIATLSAGSPSARS